MAVNSLKRNSILGETKYINFLAGNEAFDYNSDILISEQYLTALTTTVTFSNIPQEYKHLQIRWTAKNSSTSPGFNVRINGVTTASYTYHYLTGDGSTLGTSNSTSATTIVIPKGMPTSTTSTLFGQGILNILDYANETKHKPVRYIAGVGATTTVRGVTLGGGVLVDTPAVTSITLLTSANNFAVGSRFSLYGSRG